MKKKIDFLKEFVKLNDIFICPICNNKLVYYEKCLKCDNNHTFDYTKKGTINLIYTSKYHDSIIYNKKLFLNRRNFINRGFYNDVYEKVIDLINTKSNNLKILDLGCGEGTHSMNIINNINKSINYFGIDYSSDGISLATDYNNENIAFFKASVDNIPLENGSIDIVLDFLSPFNAKEVKRVLKKDGIFIKVSPGKNYLKELRDEAGLGEYLKEKEVLENIKNKFKKIKIIRSTNEYDLSFESFNELINMSPMKNTLEASYIDKITIDLNIYVMEDIK